VHPSRSLEDFVDVLRALLDEGVSFAVIGGCAVGAYARLLGLTVGSVDLDICVTDAALPDVLALATRKGAVIRSRPLPRAAPVAVLDWNGREINVLTASTGLPNVGAVVRAARELELRDLALSVPLADPFDILANKLAIRREKDLPHIEILQRFVEQEVVDAMELGGPVRTRIAPATRLLDVLGASALPESLADRLVEFADDSAVRRFLVNRVATREQAERVIGRAGADESEALEAMLKKRTFG
jgi:hypothetical protein